MNFLEQIHERHVYAAPQSRIPLFAAENYAPELRRKAAREWGHRAHAELGSVYQFSGVLRALTQVAVPSTLLGTLSRLIRDEVRHFELCRDLSASFIPEESPPEFRGAAEPWKEVPSDASAALTVEWAAGAILTACVIGETLSEPMLEAISVVATDDAPRAVARSLLRDERVHSRFGLEAMRVLLPSVPEAGKARLQTLLGYALGGFEKTTCGPVRLEDVAGREIAVAASEPNLGTLDFEQYAAIFYHTLEERIFPMLRELSFDPEAAWSARSTAADRVRLRPA